MVKQKFPVLLILGAALILGSLCWILAGQFQMRAGIQHSQQVVAQIRQILPEKTAGVSGVPSGSGMPVLEIDGIDYMALLEIPAFGVALPVADQWNSRQTVPPARFSGSCYGSTLVIGGADSPQQFGFCETIEHGTSVAVTDMTGTRFVYTVCEIDRAKRAEAQWLTEPDWDLTLFCHDTYAMEYIAVRCEFAYGG